MSKRKMVFYLLGTFLGSMALLLGIAYGLARHHLTRVEEGVFDHTREVKVTDSVLHDLDYLAHLTAIADAAHLESKVDPTVDAGSFLNQRLPWYLESVPTHRDLALPPGLRELVESWGSAWPAHLDKAPLADVDFGWMSQLLKYEYWQLEDPKQGDFVASSDPLFARDFDPTYESLPDLGLLSVWIKLRLAAIRQGAAVEPALEEIFQLAFLAMTSQRMSLIQAGLMWQELAREAESFATASEPAIHLPQVYMTSADIKKARYALPAQMAYLDFSIPAGLAGRIFPLGQTYLGACAALRQRLPALHWEEALLGKTYPDAFQSLDPLVRRLAQGCRPMPAMAVWAAKETTPPLLLARDGLLNRWFLRVPDLRKTFGLTLYDLVRSRDLEPYY